jgi:tRNA-dihydrouridine synthase B
MNPPSSALAAIRSGKPALRVGESELPGRIFLAPVAGYTDLAFRSVCLEWGADLCYTEMVSAEALSRESVKTADLLTRAENEGSYAVQLFGSDPARMARAAELVSRLKPLLIDINAGCPVPKVIRAGAGSALMRKPGQIREIIRAMRGATQIPVTVKFRLGWDDASINYLDFAAEALEGGAAALCLHARTRAQGYSGTASWEHIAQLKAAFPETPVLASGDILSAQAALRIFEESGCDGVMVARGAVGDPFIFTAIKRLISMGEIWAPDGTELSATLMRHLDRAIGVFGEGPACLEFRKHFCSYAKGMVGAAALRQEGTRASTRQDYAALAERIAQGSQGGVLRPLSDSAVIEGGG